jgi:DNA replication protein DnaC
MLSEQTVNKLYEMKLGGMAGAYDLQRGDPAMAELSFDERFGLIVDAEHYQQHNRALERRLRYARLKQPQACVENIRYQAKRGLSRSQINQLTDSRWIDLHSPVLITGPTGVGKSYLASALGNRACRDGYCTRYYYAPKLFRELLAAETDGTLSRMLRRMQRISLLIVDDLGLTMDSAGQYRSFLELLDERFEKGSVIITSQYPVTSWHEIIPDQTVADAIVDRLVHHTHNIQLKGESMRKEPR